MGEALERGREADHYRDVAHAMSTLNTVVTTGFGALAILSQLMTMGALIAVFRFKVGMLKVLAACSLAGLAYGLL